MVLKLEEGKWKGKGKGEGRGGVSAVRQPLALITSGKEGKGCHVSRAGM